MDRIDISKHYKTKGGYEVTILSTDLRSPYPVVGVVHQVSEDLVVKWSAEGGAAAPSFGSNQLDLVEVPRTVFRTLGCEWPAKVTVVPALSAVIILGGLTFKTVDEYKASGLRLPFLVEVQEGTNRILAVHEVKWD